MKEDKIISKFIQTPIGFTSAKSDLTTGKVVINNIEITSIEDWNKVTHSIVELQQENARLKDKIKTVFEYVDSLTPAGYNSGDIYSDVQDELLELLKEN